MRLKNGQPEKETAQKNRQAQTQKAAETVASQKQVTLSFISGAIPENCCNVRSGTRVLATDICFLQRVNYLETVS